MSFFRRYRDFFICVILLGLPFLFLHSNLKSPDKVNAVDRVILRVSAPVQYVAAMLGRTFSDVWGSYIYLVDVRSENEALLLELNRARRQNEKLSEIQQENQRLKHMLEFKETFEGDVVVAQVIGKDTSPFFRVMRISLNRGTGEVRPGMPVLTHEGLVGQIERIWGGYSDVLLTVDPKSSVDVLIKRNGSRGILKGTGETNRYQCRIEYLLKTDEVRIGDEVITSGMDKRFPEGIAVGVVSRLRKKEFGLFQEVWVDPAIDFSRVRDVFVMVSSP
jgi:rod shape-determining protein MreC